MKNNNMTTRKALSLGLPIKQSKRFLRVKKSMLIIFNANENLRSLDNIRRIVENSKFELDFNYFGNHYVLTSDGIKYINFDIVVGEILGVGLIDYRDFIPKVISMDSFSDREKVNAVCKLESICSHLGDNEILNLCHSVIHSLYYDILTENSEKVLFSKFVKNNKFNLEFIQSKNKSSKHQPDAWVLIDNEECPVEAKKGEFNERSLKQLIRYMTAFGSKNGVAVAKKLTVDLPSNIKFYNINGEK